MGELTPKNEGFGFPWWVALGFGTQVNVLLGVVLLVPWGMPSANHSDSVLGRSNAWIKNIEGPKVSALLVVMKKITGWWFQIFFYLRFLARECLAP